MPQKRHKKRRLGNSANGITRRRAEHKDHVWCWHFIFDRTEDGRALKCLSIVDEFTPGGGSAWHWKWAEGSRAGR